jgi:hypothetical protein
MDRSPAASVPEREPTGRQALWRMLSIFDETAADLASHAKTANPTLDEARALGTWLLQTADGFRPQLKPGKT